MTQECTSITLIKKICVPCEKHSHISTLSFQCLHPPRSGALCTSNLSITLFLKLPFPKLVGKEKLRQLCKLLDATCLPGGWHKIVEHTRGYTKTTKFSNKTKH